MAKLGMEEGQPIEHSMITKAIENAQRKVEAHNFEIRKHLLEYDDVMNKQREVIYSQRRDVLESDDIHALLEEMHTEVLEDIFTTYVPADAYIDDWDLAGLTDAIQRQYGVHIALTPENVADFDRDAFWNICIHASRPIIRPKYKQLAKSNTVPWSAGSCCKSLINIGKITCSPWTT